MFLKTIKLYLHTKDAELTEELLATKLRKEEAMLNLVEALLRTEELYVIIAKLKAIRNTRKLTKED